MGPNRDIVDYLRVQFDRTREIEDWSRRLKILAERKTIFGYANNHFAGHSPSRSSSIRSR
jgi:uncharacterized protein YecE (DUF72 family)